MFAVQSEQIVRHEAKCKYSSVIRRNASIKETLLFHTNAEEMLLPITIRTFITLIK